MTPPLRRVNPGSGSGSYIEGNALNSHAGKEEVVKYESFSPVIVRLIELRSLIGFMHAEYVENDSKSIGLNSPQVFTLSTLTRAYSLSLIDIDNPIKLSTDEVFEPVGVRADFGQRYWEKVQELFGQKWTRPDLSQAERTKYLQEHRKKKTVYFSAIFLDALGRLGFAAGKKEGWLADADLGFLDALARLDYDPAVEEKWQDMMMKKSSKDDEVDGEFMFVFNNTKDSATKVFKHLLRAASTPPTRPNDLRRGRCARPLTSA